MTLMHRQVRRGTTVVEMAAVAIIFFLILFGIMEYGRYIFLRQVLDAAAREGARYAGVNTYSTTLKTDTINVVKTRLAGQMSSATIDVYASDSQGKNIGVATDAKFGEYIAVSIDWTYQPILPSFLMLNKSLPMSVRSLVNSEAN